MENFDFKSWITENKVGPYSKMGKSALNENIEEAPVPPAPENIYSSEESPSEQEYFDRAWGLAGKQLKDAIDILRQDGFEDEEI